MDQLTFSVYTLKAGHYLSPEREIKLRIDRIMLYAGPPSLLPADHVGNGVAFPAKIYPVRTKWDGYEWSAGYFNEGWSSWRFELGQSFIGGPLAATWKGLIEWSHQFEQGNVSFRLYRKPVRTTMLSWIGLQAPQAPLVWGHVSANGVRGRGYLSLHHHFGVYGEVSAEMLDGIQVIRNTHRRATLSLPWSMMHAALADLRPVPLACNSKFGQWSMPPK